MSKTVDKCMDRSNGLREGTCVDRGGHEEEFEQCANVELEMHVVKYGVN